MPRAALALALALTIPPAALAAPPPSRLAPAFGATILSTYPDGRTARLWLARDGTYRGEGRRRTPSSGTWKVKGEKMCLKQIKPIRAPFAFCTPLPAGRRWTAKAVTGEPIVVQLVRGRAG